VVPGERERGHQSQIGHLRRKDRKAQKETRKRAELEQTADLRLQSVSKEAGGERKEEAECGVITCDRQIHSHNCV